MIVNKKLIILSPMQPRAQAQKLKITGKVGQRSPLSLPWFFSLFLYQPLRAEGDLPWLSLCLFQKYLVYGRDVLQLYFERYMLWEVYSGQPPWTSTDLTTGTRLKESELPLLHYHTKISTQRRDLYLARHNLCPVQRSMEDCACPGSTWKFPPLS